MKSVFVVQHLHVFDDGREDVKMIGAYSSFEEAKKAVIRLSDKPGFCKIPNIIDTWSPDFTDYVSGFYINEFVMDKDHWEEGFCSVEDAIQGFDESSGKAL